MTQLTSIINLSRTPLRIGDTHVPPAISSAATPVDVDLDDGLVRRDLKRFYDRWVQVDASAAASAFITGVTAGTAAANKAAVLDTNKRIDTIVVGSLKLGAGAGTAVTASAAELNKLTGAGAVVASGTQQANITNAAQTGVTNATANANAQSGSYVQADVQSIATLANSLKTTVNATITDVASLVTKVNSVLATLDAFGQTA